MDITLTIATTPITLSIGESSPISLTLGSSTATTISIGSGAGAPGSDAEVNATNVATVLHAATSKATPVDADEIPIIDTAASNTLKKLTWANLKATLLTYFDAAYASITHASTHAIGGSDQITPASIGAADEPDSAKSTALVNADSIYIYDSESANAPRTTLWSLVKATLKTHFDELYPSGSGASTGTNTGDQTSIVGITGTFAQFNTAVTDADLARTDAANTFTGVQSMTSPAIATSITTSSSTFSLLATTITTATLYSNTTSLNIGSTITGSVTHTYSGGLTLSGNTKIVNLGTGGASGSTSNINIGSANGGTTTINSPTISLGSTTGATTTGTLNLGHATDTTLSRASAGRLAVEGVEVALMTDIPAAGCSVGLAAGLAIALG